VTVEVYWNLHKRTFSVRRRGRVLMHADDVVLRDARFVVQPAGWERSVRERRRRVHAYVRGEIVRGPVELDGGAVADHFHARETGARVDAAELVTFTVVDRKPVVAARGTA
jgi:hypothetical protein